MTSRTNLMLLPGLFVALALLAGGCIEREGRPVNPCTQVNVAQAIQVTNVDKVDLLLMVDNSNSMTEEQESLAREFPIMMNILASGDFDQNGSLEDPDDFEPVRDLNVGVISSDMGTGGFSVPTCLNSAYGDDGVLRTTGNTAMLGCAATYPAILNFMPPEDPGMFATDVACVAAMGTGGCGFEQQLEAILKAVTPTAPQPWTSADFIAVGTANAPNGLDRPFFMNTQPHGDRENAGFARENAVLAIIPVTDEEDCSAHDEELFNPTGGPYVGTDLNLRCFTYGAQAQHPVERYIAGLLQLRVRPGLLIYAPITGIPVDLVPEPGAIPDWQLLVGDPAVRDDRMEERIDETMRNRLVPSCNVPDRGVAFPPVRIVRVAQGLEAAGANVTVQSICQASYSGALREIIRQITSALGAACLPRPLNLEADGSVNCDVVALLPPDMACESFGAVPQVDSAGNPIFEGTDGNRALCVLNQLVPADRTLNAPPPTGNHWYYDNFSTEGLSNCGDETNPSLPFQRIAFTAQPPSGAEVRLECFLAVQGGEGDIDRATFCEPSTGALVGRTGTCADGQTETGVAFTCDPVRRACDVQCATNADCRGAGLVGFVCDDRTLEEVDPENFAGNTAQHFICVNPTCG